MEKNSLKVVIENLSKALQLDGTSREIVNYIMRSLCKRPSEKKLLKKSSTKLKNKCLIDRKNMKPNIGLRSFEGSKGLKAPTLKVYNSSRSFASNSATNFLRRNDERRFKDIHSNNRTRITPHMMNAVGGVGNILTERSHYMKARLNCMRKATEISSKIQRDLLPVNSEMKNRMRKKPTQEGGDCQPNGNNIDQMKKPLQNQPRYFEMNNNQNQHQQRYHVSNMAGGVPNGSNSVGNSSRLDAVHLDKTKEKYERMSQLPKDAVALFRQPLSQFIRKGLTVKNVQTRPSAAQILTAVVSKSKSRSPSIPRGNPIATKSKRTIVSNSPFIASDDFKEIYDSVPKHCPQKPKIIPNGPLANILAQSIVVPLASTSATPKPLKMMSVSKMPRVGPPGCNAEAKLKEWSVNEAYRKGLKEKYERLSTKRQPISTATNNYLNRNKSIFVDNTIRDDKPILPRSTTYNPSVNINKGKTVLKQPTIVPRDNPVVGVPEVKTIWPDVRANPHISVNIKRAADRCLQKPSFNGKSNSHLATPIEVSPFVVRPVPRRTKNKSPARSVPTANFTGIRKKRSSTSIGRGVTTANGNEMDYNVASERGYERPWYQTPKLTKKSKSKLSTPSPTPTSSNGFVTANESGPAISNQTNAKEKYQRLVKSRIFDKIVQQPVSAIFKEKKAEVQFRTASLPPVTKYNLPHNMAPVSSLLRQAGSAARAGRTIDFTKANAKRPTNSGSGDTSTNSSKIKFHTQAGNGSKKQRSAPNKGWMPTKICPNVAASTVSTQKLSPNQSRYNRISYIRGEKRMI